MGQATIYYLNWDREHRDEEYPEPGPAGELFHKLTVEEVLDEHEKPRERFEQDEFSELYREVTELDSDYSVDDLEQLWKEWNRGSREESWEFYEAETRSMSIGDVVEIDGTYYQAKSIGWKEIEVSE